MPRLLPLLLCLALLSACASRGNPKDPWEGMNRAVFAANQRIDQAAIKPLAQGYDAVLPQPVKSGIANFFANLADIPNALNNLLQGKPAAALSDAARVFINSTLGLFGLIDWASDMGLEKHEEDFGQTLGVWGVGDGPYVMLPLLGPRTLRDGAGLVVDVRSDAVAQTDSVAARNVLTATRIIDNRAALLPAERVLEEAAIDRYSYLRDAYLQRRRNLIYDGVPPRLPDDDEPAAAPAQ